MLADDANAGQDIPSEDNSSPSPIPRRVTKAEVESAPEKPRIVVNTGGIAETMKAIPRWVLWGHRLRRCGKDKPPKWTKPPVKVSCPTITTALGNVYKLGICQEDVDHLNPANQHAFTYLAPLIEFYQAKFGCSRWGLGFVIDRADGLVMIDLDDCRDPTTGEVDAWAMKIVHALNSYTEVSTSGTGLKIIVRATKTDDGPHKVKVPGGGVIEVYWHAKYTATTGNRFLPDQLPADVMERQDEFDAFYSQTFSEEIERRAKHARARRELAERPSATASPRVAERMDDASVIARIRESKQAGKFAALFDRGDASAFKGDASAADFALAGMLLFWCRGDTGQVKRIMSLSALVRPKWSEARQGGTWLDYTIGRAIERHSGEYYGDRSYPRDEDAEKIVPATDEEVEALFAESKAERLRKAGADRRAFDAQIDAQMAELFSGPPPPPEYLAAERAEEAARREAKAAAKEAERQAKEEGRRAARRQRAKLKAAYPFAQYKCSDERIGMVDEQGKAAVFDMLSGSWGCCITCNRRHVRQKTDFYTKKIPGLTDDELIGNGAELVHPDGTAEQRVWVSDGPYTPEWKIGGETKSGEPKRRDKKWERLRQKGIYANASARHCEEPNYVRRYTDVDGRQTIVSTDRFDGAVPMTRAEAAALLAESIAAIPPDTRVRHPVSASEGWTPPRLKKRRSQKTLVGKLPDCDSQQVEDAMAAEGAALVDEYTPKSCPNVERVRVFEPPTTGVYADPELTAKQRGTLLLRRAAIRMQGFDPDDPMDDLEDLLPSRRAGPDPPPGEEDEIDELFGVPL